MHDIFYFVDRSVPGLSGRDILRLAKLQSEKVATPETRRGVDIGLDRRAS